MFKRFSAWGKLFASSTSFSAVWQAVGQSGKRTSPGGTKDQTTLILHSTAGWPILTSQK
jgi:hypothetical protein